MRATRTDMTLLQGRAAGTRAAAVLALAAALAGCGVNRVVPNTDMSADGQARHPIALTVSDYSTEVFPVSANGRIDARSMSQIRDFAQRYRTVGQGEVMMLVPVGGLAGAQATRLAPMLRATVEQEVSRAVAVATYPVADPSLAAPVRLTFHGIRARVAHRCGDWPNDLASGSSVQGWENKPYWNFGCSQQSMLAGQIDDPRDLVGPRGEQPTDTAFRTRAITAVRQGRDPGTEWKNTNTNIGKVGGSGGGQ